MSIGIAGLGQDIVVNGTGSLDEQLLACTGTVLDGQSPEVDGHYDIVSTTQRFPNVPCVTVAGGTWTFEVDSGDGGE